MIYERLATLVAARLHVAPDKPVASALRRFAPADVDDKTWRDFIDGALGLVPAERSELARRIGPHSARTWPELADRILPGLALGIAANDTKQQARLAGRDAWAAAIAGRALGLWTAGPPPTLPALCDALVWRMLALPGKPKHCPDELRAHFLQRVLDDAASGSGGPGGRTAPHDRLVRLIAAREVAAPRAELRALRDALVRTWLTGRLLGGNRTFADEVRDAARGARAGVFGDRKVFIAAVWHELRRRPQWAAVGLDEFKSRLVAAHRAGDLVLARADLVAAMNPDLVAASETATDGASFHFIVREAPA